MNERPALGTTAYFAFCLLAILYFAFAAIRGDLGVIERLVISAELDNLTAERDSLADEIETLKNKTYRLSDSFLDLDLLDERTRDVLGYMRADDLRLD